MSYFRKHVGFLLFVHTGSIVAHISGNEQTRTRNHMTATKHQDRRASLAVAYAYQDTKRPVTICRISETQQPAPVQSWYELAEQAAFRPAQLAALCGVSIRKLERQFNAHVNQSPKAWLAARRMETATRRILTSSDLIKTIAFDLGFTQAGNFARQFKQATTMTPGQFRSSMGMRRPPTL